MFIAGLLVLAQVQGGFAEQLATGLEAREVYEGDRLVARGVELTETVNGKRHFFSHAESGTGFTEVEAWSDGSGRPISATYFLKGHGVKSLTTVEVNGSQVTMVRDDGASDNSRTVTTEIPEGRVSMLAQFDPLRVLANAGAGTPLKVSVIDPTEMTIQDGTLVERTAGGQNQRLFDLTAGAGTSEMSISSDGKMILEQNSAGQTYRPVRWNSDYTAMARRAGIQIDNAHAAILEQNFNQASPQTVRRRS